MSFIGPGLSPAIMKNYCLYVHTVHVYQRTVHVYQRTVSILNCRFLYCQDKSKKSFSKLAGLSVCKATRRHVQEGKNIR